MTQRHSGDCCPQAKNFDLGRFPGLPSFLLPDAACVGIVAFSTFISKDRFGPRRKGCLTFTCGSRKRPFERLAPINGCRPTGMEEANIPDLCKRTDKWPPRSAHALAWPVWPARKSNRGVAARCGSSMLSSCVTPNGAERFVLASSGRISWAEDSREARASPSSGSLSIATAGTAAAAATKSKRYICAAVTPPSTPSSARWGPPLCEGRLRRQASKLPTAFYVYRGPE